MYDTKYVRYQIHVVGGRGEGGGVPAYVTPDLRYERRDLEKVRSANKVGGMEIPGMLVACGCGDQAIVVGELIM